MGGSAPPGSPTAFFRRGPWGCVGDPGGRTVGPVADPAGGPEGGPVVPGGGSGGPGDGSGGPS